MEQAHQIASQKASKASTKGKRQFDKKARAVLLEPGDRVLVRNLRETGGPGKIRAYWEKYIYIVTQQKGTNVPVYEFKRESGLGTPRVLHRNLLLPCPYLCDESENDEDREVKKTMQRDRRTKRAENEGGRDGQCQESEGDEEELTFVPAALRNENPILRENESEEHNVDNVQEVDLQDDNNVDGNQGTNAPPDDNREQTEVPVQPSERPQRLRRPPERLEYYVPGQPGYVQPIAVCTMCTQRCQSQLPYVPVTCWPPPSGMFDPYTNFAPYGNPYLMY